MVSNNSVHKATSINAAIPKVWEAITNPAQIKQWWSESPIEVNTNWEGGNDIIFSGIWYGVPYKDKGIVLAFEKEKLLKFTYLSHISKLPEVIENHTVIEFTLTPSGDETLLQLTQTNFVMETIYQHWNFYWLVTLGTLKKFIEQ